MKEFKQFVQVTLLAIAAVVVMGTWAPAAAQGDSPVDKVSFGYKFFRVSESSESVNFPLGFYVDASGDIGALPGWDWIGEVTFTRKSEEDDGFDISQRIMFFGAGLKKEFETNPAYTPHFQVLFGAANGSFSASFDGDEVFDDSSTDLAFKISGGIDYPINDKWDVRGGAGFIRVFTESEGTNIFRLFAGLVWNLN